MMRRVASEGLLDRVAIGLSGLCLVHCIATSILVALLASAGGLLGSPIVHEVGLAIAITIGAVALGVGILEHGVIMPSLVGGLGLAIMAAALALPHGPAETAFTMTGVAILALGHYLNRRAAG